MKADRLPLSFDCTPPNFCILLNYLYIFILQLIISQLFMSIFDCSKRIKHFLDSFVDEFLADLRSFFSCQILQCRVISIRIFLSIHLGNCQGILNDGRFRQLCIVEITLKIILFFLYIHRLFFT